MKKQLQIQLGSGRPSSKPKMQLGGRLLKLPSEIRLMIYEQMFPTDKMHIYAVRGSLHKAEDKHPVAGDYVAILATCRAIYTEAKPVLYAHTEFCIHFWDYYWLHYWTPADYVENFEVEDDMEPDSNDWTEHNPWLENPRSIVPIDNVRFLSLNIVATTNAQARKWTWTGQLKHTLREARHIEKLHIALDCLSDLEFDQDETNETLRIVGQTMKCGGIVTGNMSLLLGSAGFASASYYQMLAGLKGVDKTYEVFFNKLAEVWSKHADTLKKLEENTALLRSTTQERISFTEKQFTWISYSAVSQGPSQMNGVIIDTLGTMSGLQNTLQRLELEVASLQSQLESLKAGETEVR